MHRREFLRRTAAAGGGVLTARAAAFAQAGAPAIVTAESRRPKMLEGVQSGDVTGGQAVVWSRANRPARLVVEYSTTDTFKDVRRVVGPAAVDADDFTTRVELSRLPPGQTIFYRAAFHPIDDAKVLSEPVVGRFRTAPNTRRDVTIVWGGDVCGQGWGINPDFGGMKIFESMRRADPDLFVHSGDTVYADAAIVPEVALEDGTRWKNLTTPEKSKVAETLAEFHGNHRYNRLDANLRRFTADVPLLAQWDDHEVRNNWFPGQLVDDPRYTEKRADVLAARGLRAFLNYHPIRFTPGDPDRVYRAIPYGPLVEVIMLDERSYRGPNTPNVQPSPTPDSRFMGTAQMAWIKERLRRSTATWKVIASDMPIGLLVPDGRNFDAFANGDGPALGRELELADLLRFIQSQRIRNVVWITADVHYAAAHHYDPARARFTDFDPFWEFVAGPLNAGTFGPGQLDNTFGPQVRFTGIPKGMRGNRSPMDGFQFFGALAVDGKTGVLTARIHDINGTTLYSVDLPPGT